MKKWMVVLGLFLAFGLGAQDMPRFVKWLDGEHFVLHKDGGKVKVQVNARTGKETPYEEPPTIESMLPEGVRATPFNSTAAPDRGRLVVLNKGDLFLFTAADKTYRQLTATPGAEQNPVFAPDGKKLAYTRSGNLFVLDLASGLERQLTPDGGGLIYNGYASWVYFEEILGRGSNYRAFYWSPDSKRIAFLRFDDHPVPLFPIYHAESEDMTHGYLEEERYPKAGDPLPDVALAVADVQTGALTQITENPQLDYTAWVYWTPENKLLFHQMNRDQNLLHLYLGDPATGKTSKVYEESRPTWVDFYTDIEFLQGDKGFILRSYRSDWENLYHYNYAGKQVAQLTNVPWRVTGVVQVDETGKKLFFTGTGPEGTGTERHLFSVNLDGSGFRQLTQGAGTHSCTLAPGGNYFADQFSSFTHPGKLAIYDHTGKQVLLLGEMKKDANAEKGIKVEFFSVPSTDGFNLPAYWVLPPGFDPSKSYPIIFDIYGGPDAGRIFNSYRSYAADKLVNAGVILFAVDHRASGKFGKKGLDYMHRSLGKWEMHDYIETVKWLRSKPFIDSTRVGIRGGSYGGYMTAMALTYGADYFTHGVSSAPVTDWRLYDNIYTERYMDTPQDNPEGYKAGSVMTYADKFKGKLLLIHGEIDDNVHMQNTMQLVSKLQDLGKSFEMMVYPGNRHGIGGLKRNHSVQLSEQFWMKYLVGNTPGVRP